MAHWTRSHIPPQTGRLAVITGTGGLGLECALALTAAGADVIIAGRNPLKGQAAVEKVLQQTPGAKVRFEMLDLSDLETIHRFADRLKTQVEHLDLLINNAAVMNPPERQTTAEGFELQFGSNYLGHFALTAHLLPLLRKGRQPRVVSLSSIAARSGKIDFEDLQAERHYAPMEAYQQSKLACLMFALTLARKSKDLHWGITSVAAHPGISRTDLIPNGMGQQSVEGRLRKYLWFLFQPAAQGALPTLYAATAPESEGGAYYGPHQFSETRGYPVPAKIPPQALDQVAAERLWHISEQLTQTHFV